MKSVLSHARNVPSVSPHPLTCPTTTIVWSKDKNTALKVLQVSTSAEDIHTLGSRPIHMILILLEFILQLLCAEKLFTLQLLQRSKKAQKKQRVRVSWIILCISNALSTKHDNYKSSQGPQGKINPKSDSCVFCLNSNENIGFVESLKSDLRWQSKQNPAAADHSNWCQQRPFITTVPSQTVGLLYMNVRGQMFQTQEGWWGMICTGNISVWARFYNTWPVL